MRLPVLTVAAVFVVPSLGAPLQVFDSLDIAAIRASLHERSFLFQSLPVIHVGDTPTTVVPSAAATATATATATAVV